MEDEKDKKSEIGEIDNDYIIIKKFSYGGNSNVFLVKEKKTDKTYIAKVPKPKKYFSYDHEHEFLDKFKKSPYVINAIKSGKGIIKRDGRVPETNYYLILEFASNRSLDDYMRFKQQGFKEEYCKIIFYRILKCFNYIHKEGICHRDIKPDNILLDDSFHPKINDFEHAINYEHNLTGIAGTPGYQAPELVNGGKKEEKGKKKYDGYKIDIYSLGVTLFQLKFGRIFSSEEYNSINSEKPEVRKAFWDDFESKNSKVSFEFKELFSKMVSSNPDKRPKDIDEIMRDKWFGDIRNMTEEELDKYEEKSEIILLFKALRKEVNDNCEVEIKKLNDKSDTKYIQKHLTKALIDNDENEFFKSDFEIKEVKLGKYMNYYINIEGILNPRKFMNLLCEELIKEFGKDDCYIEADKNNKAKFDIIFEEDEIPGIKINENKKEIKMRIKLYKTSKGYLIRFVKKEGEKNNFIDKFLIISKLIKKLLE